MFGSMLTYLTVYMINSHLKTSKLSLEYFPYLATDKVSNNKDFVSK